MVKNLEKNSIQKLIVDIRHYVFWLDTKKIYSSNLKYDDKKKEDIQTLYLAIEDIKTDLWIYSKG